MNALLDPINTTQVVEDIKFLLSFVPATSKEQVVAGLFPTSYVTSTYEGDLELAKRVEGIIQRYNIDLADIEDLSDEPDL